MAAGEVEEDPFPRGYAAFRIQGSLPPHLEPEQLPVQAESPHGMGRSCPRPQIVIGCDLSPPSLMPTPFRAVWHQGSRTPVPGCRMGILVAPTSCSSATLCPLRRIFLPLSNAPTPIHPARPNSFSPAPSRPPAVPHRSRTRLPAAFRSSDPIHPARHTPFPQSVRATLTAPNAKLNACHAGGACYLPSRRRSLPSHPAPASPLSANPTSISAFRLPVH